MPLIHHVVAGAGAPPLVFVHGLCCSHTDWRPASRAFPCAPHDDRGRSARARCDTGRGCRDHRGMRRGGGSAARRTRRAAGGVGWAQPGVPRGAGGGLACAGARGRHRPRRRQPVRAGDDANLRDRLCRGRVQAPPARPVPADVHAAQRCRHRRRRDRARPCRARGRRTGPAVVAGVKLEAALQATTTPLLALQTTFVNDKRERASMRAGQTTPYLDYIRAKVPAARIDVLLDIGHFPQLDAPAETNRAIERFIASLP
jgi:pimeloyl-ACP methyl ester carboxylesterase